jgi:hypothetical protein
MNASIGLLAIALSAALIINANAKGPKKTEINLTQVKMKGNARTITTTDPQKLNKGPSIGRANQSR